jgi:hypothetical protein
MAMARFMFVLPPPLCPPTTHNSLWHGVSTDESVDSKELPYLFSCVLDPSSEGFFHSGFSTSSPWLVWGNAGFLPSPVVNWAQPHFFLSVS